MRNRLFTAALLLALGALLYLPGAVLWSWPGKTWALACFAPIGAFVLYGSLKRAATSHDRAQS